MTVHIRYPLNSDVAEIVAQAILSCDAPCCGGEHIEHIPTRSRSLAFDLVRLTAVNDHNWSHESDRYHTADFCGQCSKPSGRHGLLAVELPRVEDDGYEDEIRAAHLDAADPEDT